MSKKFLTRLAAGGVALALATALGGCASGGDVAESPNASGECSGEPAAGVDYAKVEAIRAPYLATDKTLPVDQPLPERPAEGLRIAYLNLGSPVAGIFWDLLQPIAEKLGAKAENVQTGSDAQSINTALNSVVESKPDIVIALGVDPIFYIDQLDQMKAGGITFAASSIANSEDFGLGEVLAGKAASYESGRVLAASALALTCGQGTDFAFYSIPELGVSQTQAEAAQETMAELCPDCTLRVVDIPVATMSTSGTDTVLSDLQAHPDTDAFATFADELQVGLPDKLELAGLPPIPGVGQSSTPPNVQQIAEGRQAEGLAVDFNMLLWLAVDQALRLDAGVPVDNSAVDWSTFNASYSSFLTEENAGEYLNGYVAQPGFEDQFAKLWGID
ncbi:sugar ABC transporter substrate-binding protein [Herbiconiux sp. A18JL235]|uniref:Sugar ABC transporter substrate-binding protein n=1 Tax=Herbiconiux sp. A18JL235 TaxID=3152363 RepID=A0AB39BI02_9MICO